MYVYVYCTYIMYMYVYTSYRIESYRIVSYIIVYRISCIVSYHITSREAVGCPVIDADLITHELYADRGGAVPAKIKEPSGLLGCGQLRRTANLDVGGFD